MTSTAGTSNVRYRVVPPKKGEVSSTKTSVPLADPQAVPTESSTIQQLRGQYVAAQLQHQARNFAQSFVQDFKSKVKVSRVEGLKSLGQAGGGVMGLMAALPGSIKLPMEIGGGLATFGAALVAGMVSGIWGMKKLEQGDTLLGGIRTGQVVEQTVSALVHAHQEGSAEMRAACAVAAHQCLETKVPLTPEAKKSLEDILATSGKQSAEIQAALGLEKLFTARFPEVKKKPLAQAESVEVFLAVFERLEPGAQAYFGPVLEEQLRQEPLPEPLRLKLQDTLLAAASEDAFRES